MSGAHVHLLLNHIPVLGTAFGLLLLLFGLARKSEEIKKVSLGIFVIAAVMALPVYFTGESAEGVVEHLPGVSEPIIEPHEKAGLAALIGIGILGLLALGGLFHFRRLDRLPGWFVTTALVLSVVVGGLMARTANLGGQIRHTEIRSGAQVSNATDTETGTQGESGKHQDDD
jgi:uncharacterized membrane protein